MPNLMIASHLKSSYAAANVRHIAAADRNTSRSDFNLALAAKRSHSLAWRRQCFCEPIQNRKKRSVAYQGYVRFRTRLAYTRRLHSPSMPKPKRPLDEMAAILDG